MYEQGTRYYIQSTRDGGNTWTDERFENPETGESGLWRSGRFTSALNQVEAWRGAETAEDGVKYRIVKRLFREELAWVEGYSDSADGEGDDAGDGEDGTDSEI